MRYCVIGRIFQYENNEEGLTVPVVNNIKYVFHQG